ncbi:L domain-like protein [Anaeromyces robustus]|uniref:L domain-like protein n=1 Tax=Anaeromyces robustus TaxID=1754192 RepID=A0A1Y1WXA5_9FUNG|nr:L domain-like protein [Anaeromyces robustus]|eukprot:ORX78170.1 L domain-like protein [Anaeromyces robustus]
MNLQFILKALSFLILTSFAFANDCDDIKDYLTKKDDDKISYDNVIEKCTVNDQGKVIELTVVNYYLQEEDVNKILSYNTIKKLKYVVRFNLEYLENYETKIIEHPGYSKFPTVISKLSELETLEFNYERITTLKYTEFKFNTPIETGSLNISKKLKNLSFSQVDFNSQNMDELSSLTNLESLNFDHCGFDKDGLSALGNNENLKTITLYDQEIPNNINKIKSLKKLYFIMLKCNSSTTYDLNGLDNLEFMDVTLLNDCKFEMSKLEKLSELYFEGETSFFGQGVGSAVSLNAPNNIKKLKFSHVTMSSDNYEVVTSLPNLEELSISYIMPSFEKFNIKSFKSHDKLRQLTLSKSGYDISSKFIDINLEFLNDLTNLNYLDLSNNQINKFPEQIGSLKKLEYINLESNEIFDKIPESYNDLENLKYFNIDNNKNIGGKVLKNKNLKECGYGNSNDSYELCIPKDFEPNCLSGNEFETCGEDEESTDGQCGEGHGKCPYTQCCSKDGKCGTTGDFCNISNNCQIQYGHCINECEEINEQLKKFNEQDSFNVICKTNEHGKVDYLGLQDITNGDRVKRYMKQLVKLSEIKSLSLISLRDLDNFELIKNLTTLTQLEIMNIDYHYSMPKEILNLTNLKILNLENTSITSIPSDISKLKYLEELYLSNNSLSKLPDGIEKLENLKILDLEYNPFNRFPKQIPNIKNLEKLIYNRIGTSVPPEIEKLEKLEYLVLNNNNYKLIPEELGNLKSLKYLDLSSNELYKFPEQLSSLKTLETLKLESNHIYDSIPEAYNNLENLKYINIDGNRKISGKVLVNKSLKECIYPSNNELCIPKDFEPNCISSDEFKACEEEENVSSDGYCGKDHGKCPSGQCCNSDGKCGTKKEFCYVSKGCQTKYGDCKDQCEELYDQLRNFFPSEDESIKCTSNEQGKMKSLHMGIFNPGYHQPFVNQLVNVPELESLTLFYMEGVENYEPLRQLKNLNTLIIEWNSNPDIKEFPKDITYLTNLKTLILPSTNIETLPENFSNLKNLENLKLTSNKLKALPDSFGKLENLKSL